MNTKTKARLETGGGQHPAVEAGPSTRVWKRPHARIDYGRLTVCLRQILRRSEEKGEALNPYTVAQRVYERYCRSLPREESKPSLSRFRVMVSLNEETAPAEVLTMLRSSTVIEGNASIDRDEMRVRLTEILAELEEKNEKLTPHRIAFLTYDRYVAGLPKGQAKPHPSRFRNLISLNEEWGSPEIRQILEASPAVERSASVDHDRLVQCLREVLKEAEARSEKVLPRNAADRTYERYVAGLPEGEGRPSLSSFRSYISLNGKSAYSVVRKILESSPVIEGRAGIDAESMLSCLREVLSEAEDNAEKLTPCKAALRTRERYGEKLPKGEALPSRSSFRNYISLNKKTALPQVIALLAGARTIEARATIDLDRLVRSLKAVLSEAVEPGEVPSLRWIADRTFERYVAGLPEGAASPSRLSFRVFVSFSEKIAPLRVREILKTFLAGRTVHPGLATARQNSAVDIPVEA